MSVQLFGNSFFGIDDIFCQSRNIQFSSRGWIFSQFVIQICVLKENNHQDRKSTRLNSSHVRISYAVFCLKKKKKKKKNKKVHKKNKNNREAKEKNTHKSICKMKSDKQNRMKRTNERDNPTTNSYVYISST